jgi:hypothetical protein
LCVDTAGALAGGLLTGSSEVVVDGTADQDGSNEGHGDQESRHATLSFRSGERTRMRIPSHLVKAVAARTATILGLFLRPRAQADQARVFVVAGTDFIKGPHRASPR